MQYPELEAGTSLDDINQALLKRGIYTKVWQLGRDESLRWSHPVVVHLTEPGNTDGHFAVWLPASSSTRQHIWMGITGIVEFSSDSFLKQRSAVVLLTSRTKIGEENLPVQDPKNKLFWVLSIVCGITAIVLITRKLLSRILQCGTACLVRGFKSTRR
jgi:ABC-type bacteriocin/lantibiotic exporter with double-glycine peptidase domain